MRISRFFIKQHITSRKRIRGRLLARFFIYIYAVLVGEGETVKGEKFCHGVLGVDGEFRKFVAAYAVVGTAMMGRASPDAASPLPLPALT